MRKFLTLAFVALAFAQPAKAFTNEELYDLAGKEYAECVLRSVFRHRALLAAVDMSTSVNMVRVMCAVPEAKLFQASVIQRNVAPNEYGDYIIYTEELMKARRAKAVAIAFDEIGISKK